MDGDLAGYLGWLRGHGVRFDVAPDLHRAADHRGRPLEGAEDRRPIALPGAAPFVEHRDPAAGLAADHATFMLAEAIARAGLVRPGTRFWDIGCGTGVLAVHAALMGARAVVATDVDPHALALAQRTAHEANVAVRFAEGSLLAPVPADLRADVVAANLPHKPVPPGYDLPRGQHGGVDGDDVHGAFAEQAAARLPQGACVCFFLHSLPHPRLLLRYQDRFALTLVAWKRRFFAENEYGPLHAHFEARHESGTSYVLQDGGPHLIATTWIARA
jgi:release factor glutamine methyltransferase